MAKYTASDADTYQDIDCETTDALLPESKIGDASVLAGNRPRAFRGNLTCFFVLQLFLISIYTTTFFTLRRGACEASLVYSPAASAVKLERVRFNATLVIESPYNGPPSKEVDAAWAAIIDNMNIAVPKSDLDRVGAASIRIPDTDNMYFAGLSVFHELHCLKRLRQYTWKEHYFPNMSANDERLNRLHTDHCLEILRQAAMCRADISLFTLQWSEDSLLPRADFSQEHECINFDAIYRWAGERRVDAGRPGILTHPLHASHITPNTGVAFPDGKGDKVGGSEDMSPVVVED
ncbi:hypothetical protein TOPH_07439 [Tolypocladium ophioglossoides CBS 100239]|uniref:Cyclochlorotine biosynthesis protein O n=1 Tax=Tolypocladium ophioglossoides (strain CBS 100239) TaxID=1163406 RepID=A0A0L0N1E5_TOLOC|nr:hypothetical protein TOPH_07439 [Tolypocladium ophioglossoides CBS 100239]